MRVLASVALLLASATAKRFGRFDSANCALPKATGPCMAYFTRYFWNAESGECEEFVYGGCRGNGNNFNTAEECERRCGAESSEESPGEWSVPFVPFFKKEKAEFMEKLAELRERFELRELFSEGDGNGSGAFNDIHEKFVDAHDKLVEKYPDGYDGVGSGLFADIHDKIVAVHDKLKDGEGFGSGSGEFLDFMRPDSEDVQNFKDEVKEATESWKAKFEEAFSHRYGAMDKPQFGGKRPQGPWWKRQDEEQSGDEYAEAVRPRFPVTRADKADRKPIVQEEDSSESPEDENAEQQQEEEETGLVAPTPSADPSEEEESNDGQSKKALRKEEKKAAKKDKKAKQAEEDSPESPEDEQAEESVEQEDGGLVAPTPSSDPSSEEEEEVAGDGEVSSDAPSVDQEESKKGKKAAKKEKKAKKAKKSDD